MADYASDECMMWPEVVMASEVALSDGCVPATVGGVDDGSSSPIAIFDGWSSYS